MLTRAGSRTAGRLRFDPATRRRVRRAGARGRPLALPAAVLLSALVVVGSQDGEAVQVAAPLAPDVPEGLVLVSVQPGDPAVLALATPGSRVDVYAAAGLGAVDLTGMAAPAPADLVVGSALVVAPPGSTVSSTGASVSGAGGAAAPHGGPLDASGAGFAAGSAAGFGAGAVTLAVTDGEAAALAARPGGSLLVAVRGTTRPTPPP